MKRTITLCLSLLLCITAFAQKWVGNTNASNMVPMEDSEFAIAPKAIAPGINGQITKVKFYRTTYDTYATNSYTIIIYENPDLQWADQQLGLFEITSCGTPVYTQEVTSDANGWVQVNLDTAYTITDAPFWVSVKMNGKGIIVVGDVDNAVEGEFFYSGRNNFIWNWSYPVFYDGSYNDYVLYSCALAVYTNGTLNIPEEELNQDVALYPNPNNGRFTVTLPQGTTRLEVYDAYGKLMCAEPVSDTMAQVDLSKAPNGFYFVRLQTEKGVIIRKVVKQ